MMVKSSCFEHCVKITLIICFFLFLPRITPAQQTFKDQQNRYTRVLQARENRKEQIDSLFNNLNISYPPQKILIVAYKNERILELWAKPETLEIFKLVKQYNFTAFSGTLGPKRKQGDMQIPEGLYYINHFNPFSTFHLSMKVNYPNGSDSILGVKGNLGGEIRIHGSVVTIGCIPIGDELIEELYVICVDTKSAGQTDIPVYIFPCRMDNTGMTMLKEAAGSDTTLLSFWFNLKKGYNIFNSTHQELKFRIDKSGKYIFQNQNLPNLYPWHISYDKRNALINRVEAPEGYKKVTAPENSFADWLRNLPLKDNNLPVYLYNGAEKSYQDGHYAIIDMDIGNKDLQQCADAIIRLYAEYLYSQSDFDNIAFGLTNGDVVKFRKWISGYRPDVNGNTITWHKQEQTDSSYNSFKKYLKFIFTYAGTYSLSQQLRTVSNLSEMEIGDVFVQGGFPGHAVLVVDMAINPNTGEKIFLLCQSYMPAQDIHILKNLKDSNLDPWYKLDFGNTLYTPEWNFMKHDLKRF